MDGNSYDIILENRSRVIAVDFDIRQDTIYWSDVTNNAVYRARAQKNSNGVLSDWKVQFVHTVVMCMTNINININNNNSNNKDNNINNINNNDKSNHPRRLISNYALLLGWQKPKQWPIQTWRLGNSRIRSRSTSDTRFIVG